MERLLTFPGGARRDPEVERWFIRPDEILATIARRWFDLIRACGDDVVELLHDGCPTACVRDAGFAYVNAFTAHVNVGFFLGAYLPDPAGLLEGTGKRMRHVKLKPGMSVNEAALADLIRAAFDDICERVRA